MDALPAASPAPLELVAPGGWRCVDFISDLHLAEDTPRAFEAWRDYLLRTPAEAVFILGDLFEVWLGDDSRHEGFEAQGATVLTKASALRDVFFMVGNRDFLLGREMLDACGVQALPDPTTLTAFGERVLLTHGDAWCIGDVPYQEFRRQVRSPAWQKAVLQTPLDYRRKGARILRSESERKALETEGGEWFDVDVPTALRWMDETRTSTLVHGHTHRPASQALAPGRVRHVLSDWECDRGGNPRAEVLRYSPGRWTRLPLSEACCAGG